MLSFIWAIVCGIFEWKLIVQFYLYCFLIVICILPFVPLVYVTFRIHLGNTEAKGPDLYFHEKQKPDTFLT
jgi:hypothetical protein